MEQITLRVVDAIYQKLSQNAKAKDLSLNAYLISILLESLKAEKTEEPKEPKEILEQILSNHYLALRFCGSEELPKTKPDGNELTAFERFEEAQKIARGFLEDDCKIVPSRIIALERLLDDWNKTVYKNLTTKDIVFKIWELQRKKRDEWEWTDDQEENPKPFSIAELAKKLGFSYQQIYAHIVPILEDLQRSYPMLERSKDELLLELLEEIF